MSTPSPKRCPNCAWAMGLADTLQLPQEESWILTVIAENIGPDMQLHATHAELSRMTRMKPATLSKHVRSLAERPGCIKVQRSRDGYHYTLDRPDDAHSKPRQIAPRVRMPYDDDTDQEQQNLQFPAEPENADFAHQEPQNLHFSTPKASKSADQELQNLRFPLMNSPLKVPLVRKKEPSLRSGRAREATAGLVSIDRIADARSVWNDVCVKAGMPACREMPDARRKALQRVLSTRFSEPDAWGAFCRTIAASAFLTSGGFGIDWVLKPANMVKIIEGNYGERSAIARKSGVSDMQRRFHIPPMAINLDPEPIADERRLVR